MNLKQQMVNTARELNVSLDNHVPSIKASLSAINMASITSFNDAIADMRDTNLDALVYTIRLYSILKHEYASELDTSLDLEISIPLAISTDLIKYKDLSKTNKLIYEIMMHLSLLPINE